MNKLSKLKHFAQRAIKGYDDNAVYGFCYWFLDTMPKILNDMADSNEYAIPIDFNTVEEWNQQVREIAGLFREAGEDTCSMKNEYLEDYLHRFFELGQEVELDDRWKVREEEVLQYRRDCLHKAMTLLEKHFDKLWI